MEILLINPNPTLNTNNPKLSTYESIKCIFNIISAPLSFPMLAAVTPDHHKITIVDELYQKINFNRKYDLVGITTLTPSANRAYEIADEFRRKGVKVVIGGNHPTILPHEAKEHADGVVVGEAEETWPQLLKDMEENRLKPFYHQTRPVDLDKTPKPRRNIINRTFIAAGVQASRGCPHKCKYCFYSNSPFGNIYRKRPVEQIVEEIKSIPQKLIIFHDASFTIDIDYKKNFSKL